MVKLGLMMAAIVLGNCAFAGELTETKITDAKITAYDCTLDAMDANDGKCEFVIEAQGRQIKLTASPEVGAPWGNFYGPDICHPRQNLSLTVSDGEIISVKDAKGNGISTKFDYSR